MMQHHPHDYGFIQSILDRLPGSVLGSVRSTYTQQYEQAGRQAANHYLLAVKDCLQGKTLLVHSDEALRAKAERLAKNCHVDDLDRAERYLASVGLPLPQGITQPVSWRGLNARSGGNAHCGANRTASRNS
ncbi:MAG: hypothetical protein R3E89_04655 [Thiolinea sp.]